MKLAFVKVRLPLVVASIMMLLALFVACTPSQEPLPVQQGASLLSNEATETADEFIISPAFLVGSGGTKEAVSVDDFISTAEELSFEVLRPADMKFLGGFDTEQMQRDEEAGYGRIVGFGYRGIAEIIFVDWNIPEAVEADFANVRSLLSQPSTDLGVKSNVRGLNYDYISLGSEEDFYITVRVEDTLVMAEGVSEGIDAVHALLEAIGYQ